MKSITRYHLPTKCPRCQGVLQKYHGGGETRYVCAAKCTGYEVVAMINHGAEHRGDEDAIMLIDLDKD